MRSGRAKAEERRTNDGLEQTPDRKRKKHGPANADPELIDERDRIEEFKRTLENDDKGAAHPCRGLHFSERIRPKPDAQKC